MPEKNPSSPPESLVAEGAALQREGDLAAAIDRLRAALALDPQAAEAWFRLAQIAFQTGNVDESIELLKKATESAPAAGSYHLRLGTLQLRRGDREAAAESFQRAMIAQPELAVADRDRNLPESARREIAAANALLRAKYVALVEETVAAMRRRYPGAMLARLERCFRFLTGREEKVLNHPRQRPEFLLFPDLPARPWMDTACFDWVPRLEVAWPEVRRECERLLAERERFEPYVHGVGRPGTDVVTRTGIDITSLADSRAWTAFHLVRGGRLEANCARCPATDALVSSLPLANVPGYMPDVLFSLLEPGARIQPHYGQNNVRVTVHLGLLVPDDCGLRVGGETRAWEAGRALAFDDSFLHEAWNDSDADRAVLIFKVWNPELNEAEIAGLEHFFATRNAWLARFEAAPA